MLERVAKVSTLIIESLLGIEFLLLSTQLKAFEPRLKEHSCNPANGGRLTQYVEQRRDKEERGHVSVSKLAKLTVCEDV